MSRKSRRRRKAARRDEKSDVPSKTLTWRVHPFAQSVMKSVIAVAAVLGMGGLAFWVSWDLGAGMPKTVYPWDGPEVYPMCPDFGPAELPQIRSRVIDCIMALE